MKHYTGIVDFHLATGYDHLMVVMLDVNSKTFEFSDESFNLLFNRIPSHIAQIFVIGAAKYFEHSSSDPVGYCDFGFIGWAQAWLKFSVLRSVVRTSFLFRTIGGLDEKFS